MIAHRGASGYAPENTFSAFVKAIQLGVKWVEFDVLPTLDDVPIIFHDEMLLRTTQHSGSVYDFPYHYLATLDAGTWFAPTFASERIPRLDQILKLLNETKTNANIEIKSLKGHGEQFIDHLLNTIKPYWNQGSRYLFSSFCVDTLRLLRKSHCHCDLGLLLHEWQADWQDIYQELQCVSVHINQEILTRELAREIKASAGSLLAYTVNDAHRAQELFKWGVDAVFSDYPDRMLKLR